MFDPAQPDSNDQPAQPDPGDRQGDGVVLELRAGRPAELAAMGPHLAADLAEQMIHGHPVAKLG